MGKQVFISSATGAINPYRQAAIEACYRLGLTPIHMESFSPDRLPPLSVCQDHVDGSDVFILLLAHRYGSRPPGETLSYTELEYERARSHPAMPILAFVVDPSFPWDPRDLAHGDDAESLKRLTAEVQQRHLVKIFGELSAFQADLLVALQRYAAIPAPVDESRGLPMPPAFHAAPPYVGSAPFTGRADDLARLDDWGRSTDPVMVVEAIGGTGKSALSWQWTVERAPEVIRGLEGRMWWSFYDGSASISRFMREALAYLTDRPLTSVQGFDRTDLADQLIKALRHRPHLLVLDGFERLLGAYHRFDPSKLRDDEVEPAKRSLIDPYADEIMRQLTAVAPSKILISTRLMPTALEGRFGSRMPGVRQLQLPGLNDADTVALLSQLGVEGGRSEIREFFQPLGNHPLLVGIVAGVVRRYRPDPGNFDSWLADPQAGGIGRLSSVDLVQRRTHILAAALDGLSADSDRVLGYISALPGAVGWDTLVAINPLCPPPPDPVKPDFDPYALHFAVQVERATAEAARAAAEAERATALARAEWEASAPVQHAQAKLAAVLQDLEERGLLWWDRAANSYDLHPVIRAYVYDRLQEGDRISVHDAVRDHFQAQPPDDVRRAKSVEDLRKTITIFRSFVGSGKIVEGSYFWQANLSYALLVGLGANSTVVELLTPVGPHGPRELREDLVRATRALRRYDAAIHQTVALLREALEAGRFGSVGDYLDLLGLLFRDTGAAAKYARCVYLQGALIKALGRETALNPGILLRRADLAVVQGRVETALSLLDRADILPAPTSNPYYAGDVTLARLRLSLLTGETVAETHLAEAEATLYAWPHRAALVTLRRMLLTMQGQFAPALELARKEERLARNAGRDTIPAVSAYLLAKLGRKAEAEAAVEESLALMPRLHPGLRPHHALARALTELDRLEEAGDHARAAYRQAWCDGPPHCHHWNLRDATALIEKLGGPVPDLPVVDPATVGIPLEEEVREFILQRERYLKRSTPLTMGSVFDPDDDG